MTTKFNIYFCVAKKGDYVSEAIKWWLRLTEWEWTPITHVFVETCGMVFEYTMAGVTMFLVNDEQAMQRLHERTLFKLWLDLNVEEKDVFENAFEMCSWKPMTWRNFFDPKLPLCTDIFYKLAGYIPTTQYVRYKPHELFASILAHMETIEVQEVESFNE